MADDIVTRYDVVYRLREPRDYRHGYCEYCDNDNDGLCSWCSARTEAADEIERLRALGDALAKVWGCYSCEEFGENVHEDDNGNSIPCPAKTAYYAWEEARRG